MHRSIGEKNRWSLFSFSFLAFPRLQRVRPFSRERLAGVAHALLLVRKERERAFWGSLLRGAFSRENANERAQRPFFFSCDLSRPPPPFPSPPRSSQAILHNSRSLLPALAPLTIPHVRAKKQNKTKTRKARSPSSRRTCAPRTARAPRRPSKKSSRR